MKPNRALKGMIDTRTLVLVAIDKAHLTIEWYEYSNSNHGLTPGVGASHSVKSQWKTWESSSALS